MLGIEGVIYLPHYRVCKTPV